MKQLVLSVLLLAAAALSAQGPTRQPQLFQTAAGAVKITPIYHASLVIEAAGKVIYVDPASPANYTGLPKADLILVTHDHYDHLDARSIKALRKPSTEIWGPASVAAQQAGVQTIANGQKQRWGAWTIEAVPMYNLKRGPSAGQLFHDKGRGDGFVLTFGGKRFYISGDTENIPEMRTLKNIDVAFVCMNLPYTMTAEEASDAILAFRPKIVIPYHYQQTNRQILVDKLKGSGVEVRLLEWYPK